MPCGGGGFAGGGPGSGMHGEGNGMRQGFSGGVPGRERSWIFWRSLFRAPLAQLTHSDSQQVASFAPILPAAAPEVVAVPVQLGDEFNPALGTNQQA
eukprot:1548990-Rhodomonas_salina.1